MQSDGSKLRIILFGILVVLAVSGWVVSRKVVVAPVIKEPAAVGGGEAATPVGEPEVEAFPLKKGPGITLTLARLLNVDKVDVVLTYDWRGRPEQYVVSEDLKDGQREFSTSIRFESCSGSDCIYHQVDRGKFKLSLSNESGGEWEGDFKFKMGGEKVTLGRD